MHFVVIKGSGIIEKNHTFLSYNVTHNDKISHMYFNFFYFLLVVLG